MELKRHIFPEEVPIRIAFVCLGWKQAAVIWWWWGFWISIAYVVWSVGSNAMMTLSDPKEYNLLSYEKWLRVRCSQLDVAAVDVGWMCVKVGLQHRNLKSAKLLLIDNVLCNILIINHFQFICLWQTPWMLSQLQTILPPPTISLVTIFNELHSIGNERLD